MFSTFHRYNYIFSGWGFFSKGITGIAWTIRIDWNAKQLKETFTSCWSRRNCEYLIIINFLTNFHIKNTKYQLLYIPILIEHYFFLKVRTKDRTFDSVSHLINYHRDNALPIISAESALRLKKPVLSSQQSALPKAVVGNLHFR